MMSPTKKQNPELSNFLMQMRRLAASSEGLNRSLGQSPDKLCSCKVAWK